MNRKGKVVGYCLLTFLTASPAWAQVQISKNANTVTIGNQYLSRTFSIADGVLKTQSIENKRTDGKATVYTPAAGSEEFVIRALGKPVAPMAIGRKGWTATASSWCNDGPKSGKAEYIIDGDKQTLWHTNYRDDGTGSKDFPFWFDIDMKKENTFKSFAYVPRQGAENGRIKGFELYVSNSLKDIEQPQNLVMKGELTMNGDAACWMNLPKEAKGRYIRFKEISSQNGLKYGTCAEFYVSKDNYIDGSYQLKPSAMKLNGVKEENIEGGKRLVFDLAPYQANNIDWDVDVVYEMKDNDHFMRKYLRIAAPQQQQAQARIDYIDMEHLGVASADNTWTHPEMGEGVGGMSGYHISLGQPVYIDGMFLGSEFPQTENEIADQTAHVRYYSGKSLAELGQENRLDAQGAFTTWKNVLGATRSATDMDVIQSDFFAYINSIARPANLRIQYNSWFDWMMDITEENILSSFKEVERGLSQQGIRPVDSYVVDDGWNAYGPYEKENTTGFWQFNSKFPNGLTKPSDFAHRVSSNFGIWLGPRGGYNYQYDFAQFLEKNGNGTVNKSNYDIVTGDKQYLKKLQEFFLDCQNKYDVNYWKLDGFCAKVPQPSENGRYITGGKNGMYYMTEHWERWANLLDTLYLDADKRNSNLWINLTCYMNPSPWLLQWCQSVWLQISADMGRIKVDDQRDRELDMLLSYRDDRYFDFIKTRQFQFPFSNIFNHDPLYGKTYCVAPNSMDDEEFRTYLYMMATRGAAFWELLYSYNMMDEGNKWMINAEALRFLENNYDILRHAKLIGETPANGNCYGYSCWNDKEGIISVRNPKSEPQTFTIKLNRTIGVPEQAKDLWRTLVINHNSKSEDDNSKPFQYNDEISVTLQGGEVRIWKFSPDKDTTPAELVCLKASDDTIRAEFDEPVKVTAANFSLSDGTQAVSAETLPDNRTVLLTFGKELKEGKAYKLNLNNIADWNGNNTLGESPEFYAYDDQDILELDDERQLKSKKTVKAKMSVSGTADFNVSCAVNTTTIEGNLISQEGAFSVVLEDGKVKFTVGQLSVTSNTDVADGKWNTISCCREKNGMLKIYINGVLDKSVYNADILNENLSFAPVTIGQKGLTGSIKDVELENKARTFAEVD